MKTSQRGIDLIKKYEGLVLYAYQCPSMVWTIGYGHTSGVYQGMTITEKQAEEFLREDLKIYENGVFSSCGFNPNQNEYDAMVSFAYNCGTAGLLGSTLYKNICKGVRDVSTITANFQGWSYGGGKRIEGLYRRRTKEAAMLLNADYTCNN